MRMRTIREIREEQGMRQAKLAKMVDVTPVTVYNWERGKYEPSASMLRKVARALDVSMDEIIFEVEEVKTAA